jgi:TolB-like protein
MSGSVQAGDGAQLWSQEYDAPRADIFAVEEDIAKRSRRRSRCP